VKGKDLRPTGRKGRGQACNIAISETIFERFLIFSAESKCLFDVFCNRFAAGLTWEYRDLFGCPLLQGHTIRIRLILLTGRLEVFTETFIPSILLGVRLFRLVPSTKKLAGGKGGRVFSYPMGQNLAHGNLSM